MKNNILISFYVMLCAVFMLNAQTTAIPDVIFEDYLETHDADGAIVPIGDATSMGDGIANNGLVTAGRIETVTSLNVDGLGISDLSGIEGFLTLETLICSNNSLTNLDISNNLSLISLLCGSNFLNAIALNSNTNLETLNCSDNQIQDLAVSDNTALESLTASGNQLTTLDVSNNPNLFLISVSNNRITGELIVSNNSNLESLFCSSNQISALNLGANTVLKNLDASNNALTDLDLSSVNTEVCPDPQTDPLTLCQGVSSINVSRNQLTSLTVANGHNDLFTSVNSSENPDLFCIQIDNGYTPSGWIKDDWTYYGENPCVDIFTYMPDDNFEQTLINQGYDDTLDNFVLTENINDITTLNVSNASISSLVGIEDFIALEVLDGSTNMLETIDLSLNTELVQLDLSNNNLSNLDLSTNTALTILFCESNALNILDLSTNIQLTTLNCSTNALINLDVSNNALLTDLDISFNEIQSLNVVANPMLITLLCNDNDLFALKMDNGNNTMLTTFNVTNNNNLFCIEVDDVAFANTAAGWQKDATADYSLTCGTYVPDDNFEQALIDLGIDSDNTLNNFVPTADISAFNVPLDISGRSISDLTGIQDFLLLENLNCSGNNLTVLNLETNNALTNLNCSNNQIEALELSANINLTTLFCNNNELETLNIANGFNNALTVLDATDNATLFCINVDTAIIGNIPANWQIDPFADYNDDCINNRFTAIPDPFFEQVLIDLGFDTVIDGQVLTADIEQIQDLEVSDQGISDLRGIQDFKALVALDCSGNFLDKLNVSDMLFLERLNCSSNFLLTNDTNEINGLLNITGTINLRELYCSGNFLNTLDISQNTNLEILDCADNNLSNLTINNNTLLRNLNCSNNNLTEFDLSNNTALEDVNFNSNRLNDLITSGINNTTLAVISCANNNLVNLLVNNYAALTTLNCGANALTQLNLTNNPDLSYLSVSNNELSELDLLNNTNLVEVLASQNSLSQIDLAANTLLERLNLDFNDLTVLALNTNLLLEFFSGTNNQLTELDLSNNTNLISTNVSSNLLTSLILSNDLSLLKSFNASGNELQDDLDLTSMATSACVSQGDPDVFCPEIIAINVSNNLLSFVNIQNGINAEIINFNASGNPNLECIQVDDSNAIGANWLKDEATSYNEDCNFGETFVPDDNFEQALIALGLDVGPLNDYVLTATIEGLTSLDVSGNAIADLTGIEDFIALTSLNVSNNALSEVDISANTNLINVDCSNNLLTDIELVNNTLLASLNCSSNAISNIDLSANTNLSDLNISNNTFTTFFPSEVLSLQVFSCNNNGIVELDFQQNQFLTSISCQSNLLETLNIRNGQNVILTNLNASDNPTLSCIETDNGTVPNAAMWLIDSTAQFAINCFFGQTNVPDNNFEQALIDLGYDSGALDDYVPTENIEDLTFLNVSGREILDLTGIEDFINLTTLDVGENTISTLNLTTNMLLVDLDASNNLLTELDIAMLTNLTILDISDNSLIALNLDVNTNLTDLDVSNNLFTNLNVSELVNLEELNCASNQLSSLSVTQNSNLRLLFCQSNVFVADQLNLQNGNNENLELFNATNNPDLGCILVDDPVAVITNADGFYDDWIKDDTASYQSICEDADNDGVPNDDDLCPNTAFGALVDFSGCAYLNLPNDNFNILITGETCLNSNNGKITITALEIYSYTVTLERGDFYQEYDFTNDIDIFNLLSGTYEMCITIAEWPDYEICYTIIIIEPDPLEVFASRSVSGDEWSVTMTGSSKYYVEFNDDIFTTFNPIISLELRQGTNTLKVRTDLECQGVYEEKIWVNNEARVYPNPFSNSINIYQENEGEALTVNMYSLLGELILNKTFIDQDHVIKLDTSRLAVGLYLISIASKTMTRHYKIIKE